MERPERISSRTAEAAYLARCFQQAYAADAQLAAEGYLHSSTRLREKAVLRSVVRSLAER
jgi:hypothetical protein